MKENTICVIIGIGILAIGAGCASPRETVVTPPPVVEVDVIPIVTGPLPGVDSLVVAEVAASYDSTFVAAVSEQVADQRYLDGRQIQIRLDSLLRYGHGESPLSNESQTLADSTTLERAGQTVAAAVQAQAQQDSAQALSLLVQAQQLYEATLQYNPFHEDARFQLSRIYQILAQRYQLQDQWESALHTLRGLVDLNADQHALWADMAVVLDTLKEYESSGLAWLQAASVVLDDANLAFTSTPVFPDSLALFNYYQRAYTVFVKDRNGDGVRQSLSEAINYATDSTQFIYATRENQWALWDGNNFDHRLQYDSLLTLANDSPQGGRDGLWALIQRLATPPARLEAHYNAAILTWQLEEYDQALDTLQWLWAQTQSTPSMPYPEFPVHLQETYANVLYQRGMQHKRAGASAIAFTYLLMVTELESRYVSSAYIEALKLTRSNPRQARKLEPQIEKIYDLFTPEEQRTYLSLMGNLYRRIGDNEKAQSFLARYKGALQ